MGKKGQAPRANVDNLDVFILTTEELKEAAREAREALKDLQAERKMLAEERKRIEDLMEKIPQITQDAIGDLVMGETATISEVYKKAMEKGTAQILEKFQEVGDTLLGKGRKVSRDPTITELLGQVMDLPPGVPVEITVQRD